MPERMQEEAVHRSGVPNALATLPQTKEGENDKMKSFFSTIGHKIAAFFTGHQAVIQTVIADAQTAAGAATSVATALGEPASVTDEIAKVSDGLSKVGAAVTAETTADTLTQHASDLADLTSGLLSDIGVKNAQTVAAIGSTAIKVQGVIGALEVAAASAPSATPAV